MIAAAVFLVAATGSLAPGFRFRLDAADAARYADPGRFPATGVAVVLRTGPDGSRVDVLVRSNDRLPRWSWSDAGIVAAGRVSVRAPAGSSALVVVRDRIGPGYRVDGPFAWPSDASEREVVARPVRSVRGSSPLAGSTHELRLAEGESHGDPLCETDEANEWQCVAIPRGFSGRLAVCRGAAVVATGELRPDSAAELVLRPVTFGALLRLQLSEPEVSGPTPSVRLLRPPRREVLSARADPRWTVFDMGNDLVWIETSSGPSEAALEVSAPGHATKRFAIHPDEFHCVEPISLVLPRAATVAGAVIDPTGSPVRDALVLLRTVGATEAGPVVGDAETDASGEFEILGLEPASHRIRACHGEHGCVEETAVPGVPLVLRLPGQGAFVGRVLSSSGVPQAGVAVQILPTEKTWAAADDRLTRLPLRTESDSDGRFRITAAENGDYLVEARTRSSGVARVAVRRSRLSPRVTDLGDLRLPEPIDFVAKVAGCVSGTLFLSGPLGGETSLPTLVRLPLDADGSGTALLPEGGAWTAWASCFGAIELLEPSFLPDAAGLDGLEVGFARAGTAPGSRRD